jgi:hypothetical protein
VPPYQFARDTIQFSRRARSIHPNNIQFLYNEAEALALANRPKEALRALRQAFQKATQQRKQKTTLS